MRIQLATPAARGVALLAIFLVVITDAYVLQRHMRAAAWARSASAEGLQRSLRLEQSNAEVWHALARNQLYSEQDPAQAMASLQQAVSFNPHSPWYWLDLSLAHQITGAMDKQLSDVEHASAVDPRTPLIAWEAANLYLANGNVDKALDRFRTVIENDPDRAQDALRLCWRATADVGRVLVNAVPDSPEAHLAFINVLVAERRTNEALRVWEQMQSRSLHPEPRLVGSFLEYLVRERQTDGAVKVWRELINDPSSLRPAANGQLVMVDPGFEDEPLTGGFRWRISAANGVDIAYDDAIFRSGTRSLRMIFAGPGVQQPGVGLLIPVEPSAKYEIRTAIRTEDLASADPPHWFVNDAYTHQPIGMGPAWISPGAWRDSSVSITVPSTTNMIEIVAWRPQQQTHIKGVVWLDDLRMVKR